MTTSRSKKKQIRMTTFTELPLSAVLQQKLAAAQFTTLTPIQEQAIPPALEGKDVIGTAQTGTGKTSRLSDSSDRGSTSCALAPNQRAGPVAHA